MGKEKPAKITIIELAAEAGVSLGTAHASLIMIHMFRQKRVNMF